MHAPHNIFPYVLLTSSPPGEQLNAINNCPGADSVHNHVGVDAATLEGVSLDGCVSGCGFSPSPTVDTIASIADKLTAVQYDRAAPPIDAQTVVCVAVEAAALGMQACTFMHPSTCRAMANDCIDSGCQLAAHELRSAAKPLHLQVIITVARHHSVACDQAAPVAHKRSFGPFAAQQLAAILQHGAAVQPGNLQVVGSTAADDCVVSTEAGTAANLQTTCRAARNTAACLHDQ